MDGGAPQTAWPSSFPALTTKRLRLRAPLLRDAAALRDILGDPEVTRYHNMPTLTTLAEAGAALERLQHRYAARDTIRWAIEQVEHGDMIGTVGLLRFDFEHRRAEVGYEIARRLWGRGLAPEAAAAVIKYASVRVLQKLGFLEEGTRRDFLYAKGRFMSFRWFSLLEGDESSLGGP